MPLAPLAVAPTLIALYAFEGPEVPLTYAVPEAWAGGVAPGMLVKIPLGPRKTLGVVLEIVDAPPPNVRQIKYILEIVHKVPILTPDLLRLLPWLSTYYAARLGAVLETMVPSAVRDPVRDKQTLWVALGTWPSEAEWAALSKRAPKQAALLEFLKTQKDPIIKGPLLESLDVGPSTYKALLEKGFVVETALKAERTVYDDALADIENEAAQGSVTLSSEQSVAAESIKDSLAKKAFNVHLLHGVTGSGKTEVYIEAAKAALAEGGSVLFLVPEVALTPQTVARLRARLSASGVQAVVLHSHLSAGERLDAWMSLARGEARVAVGARSAVFAPLKNLKLIVVDEEHESAYKQEDSPRYHGRDVAVYRAKLAGAVCVLGSATPSLESLYNLQVKGYQLNALTKRIDDRALPPMHIVDMRNETSMEKGTPLISRFLLEKLKGRLAAKEQTILFLNRRGFAPKVMCGTCGHVVACNHCSISLTFHRALNHLRCHLCNHERPLPRVCPECKGTALQQRGAGTQRIEDILPKLLPGARITRIDADLLDRKNAFRQVLGDFRKGKIDILIGTQMIAKGFDFPNVTLVGLIEADLSLHMPDFRAAERTFQLLVQVAGRAGRGDRAGEVVVQTYTPASAPLQFARRCDFEGFLAAELEERRVFNYPPFRHLIRHVFRARNAEKASFFIEEWTRFLEKQLPEGIELRGPAIAPREKVKDYYRYHLWYFTSNVSRTLPHLLALRNTFKMDKDVIDTLDVDPVDLG